MLELEAEYCYGSCMWLAIALHQQFGWPLWAFITLDGSIDHAFVRRGDHGLDIFGWQPIGDIEAEWKTEHRTSLTLANQLVQVSLEELRSYCWNWSAEEENHEVPRANAVIHFFLRERITLMYDAFDVDYTPEPGWMISYRNDVGEFCLEREDDVFDPALHDENVDAVAARYNEKYANSPFQLKKLFDDDSTHYWWVIVDRPDED